MRRGRFAPDFLEALAMTKEIFRKFFESKSMHFVGMSDPFKLNEGLTDQKLDLLWAMYVAGVLKYSRQHGRSEFRIG